MSTHKSDKELAFLHDLYVATDWGERFAELVDEHVRLPKEGRALYVASGTGGHALALAGRAGRDVEMVCVDESEGRLELARAKAAAVKGARVEFRHAQLEALAFEDEQFDLVVGEASLVAPERLPEMLSEMVRVAAPGATVALNVATASSFGEFFSVYWEALAAAGSTLCRTRRRALRCCARSSGSLTRTGTRASSRSRSRRRSSSGGRRNEQSGNRRTIREPVRGDRI